MFQIHCRRVMIHWPSVEQHLRFSLPVLGKEGLWREKIKLEKKNTTTQLKQRFFTVIKPGVPKTMKSMNIRIIRLLF